MRHHPLLAASLLASALFMSLGCGGTPPSRAQPGETCFGTPIPCDGRRVESCCMGSPQQCAYRVSDGTDFPCDGSNCNEAAEQVNLHCQG